MPKANLRDRLFWSHLCVLGIGLLSVLMVGWTYSPRLFVIYLQRINYGGYGNISTAQVETQLLRGFNFAWGRSMVWAGILGSLAASSTSYWLSRRIIRPLLDMEAVTREFALGHLDHRLPTYEIQELTQLANSVNQMATELAQVEQRRRELVGDLSHELRTPLTILKGYVEALSDGTVAADPVIYQHLGQEIHRIQRLVQDLGELSQLESGYLPIRRQGLDLAPLLTSLVGRFQDQRLPDDPVQLQLHCDPDLPRVAADPERLEQIVVNLLTNALRYTDRGAVVVRAETRPEAEGWVWISVADTGEGIAAADLPHVFDRFWRADRSRDRASGGSGIGLTICQRLVTLHGGDIQVTSRLGEGSTFRFSLPVIPPQGLPPIAKGAVYS